MIRLFLLLAALTAAAGAQACGPKQAPAGSDTVFVRGLVRQPLTLTTHDLQGLPTAQLDTLRLTDADGKTRRALAPARGMLLRDILRKAGTDMPHKQGGAYLVVVTATDGLQVVFACNELLYGPAADHAYLILPAAGDAADGPFTTLCTSDRATTPRYVKWVRSIEVRKIEP